MTYNVEITFKKHPVLNMLEIKAETEQEAKQIAVEQAKLFGWSGKVKKITAKENRGTT